MASKKWYFNEKRNSKEQLVDYPALTRERERTKRNKQEREKNRKMKKKKEKSKWHFLKIITFSDFGFLEQTWRLQNHRKPVRQISDIMAVQAA